MVEQGFCKPQVAGSTPVPSSIFLDNPPTISYNTTMGQYTDKINRISEDFYKLEEYERVNCLLGQNGCLVLTHNHGGYTITTSDRPGEYNSHKLGPNEKLYIESTNEDYLKLKQLYGSNRRPLLTQLYDKWQQLSSRFKKVDKY